MGRQIESGSFQPWVVSAKSFRPGSIRPYFKVSQFGLFWWVFSAVSRFGRESFRPWVVSASLNLSPKIHLVGSQLV